MAMRRDGIARREFQLDDERPGLPRIAGHDGKLGTFG
jgi:hypothetical protein